MTKIEVEEKIDLTAIIKKFWNSRKLYFIPCVVAVFLGAVIALSIPNSYKVKVVLAPEISSNSNTDKLTGLASMVGINLGGLTSSSVDAFYPTIYPNVIESTPFVLDLFDVKLSTQDGKLKDVTFFDYLTKYQKSSPFLLPLSWLKSSSVKSNSKVDNSDNVVYLSKAQADVKKAINGLVTCNVDKRTDIITISVVSQDPLVSATLADTVTHRLQKYIIKYRTKKAKNDLNYALQLQSEAKRQFDEVQQKYTSYVDKHLDMAFETPKQKAKELENDMNLKYQMYTQVSQQVQIAKAKVQERTPSFSEIEPAVVPTKKNGPARTLIVLCFLLVAIVGTSVWILAEK